MWLILETSGFTRKNQKGILISPVVFGLQVAAPAKKGTRLLEFGSRFQHGGTCKISLFVGYTFELFTRSWQTASATLAAVGSPLTPIMIYHATLGS